MDLDEEIEKKKKKDIKNVGEIKKNSRNLIIF